MFSKIGTSELLVIIVIALLIFGPDKMPELARNLGKAIGNIKKYMYDTENEIRDVVSDLKDVENDIKK